MGYLQLTELAKYRPLMPSRPPAKLAEKPVYLYSLPTDSAVKLVQPLAVAVGKRGLIYVTDVASHSVKVFYPVGQLAFSFGQPGTGQGHFGYPYGIAILPGWHVLVSDSANGSLQEFTPRGEYVRTWLKPGSGFRPGLLDKDAQGNIYVSDLKQGQVLVFGPSGQLRFKLGGQDNPLGFPQGVGKIDANIWIADAGNNKIKILTGKNKTIKEVAPLGWSFSAVRGLSVDSLKRVLAADALSNQIAVFDHSGNYLFSFGGGASAPRSLAFPTGLAASQAGAIYIADRGNQRVQVWGYPR